MRVEGCGNVTLIMSLTKHYKLLEAMKNFVAGENEI